MEVRGHLMLRRPPPMTVPPRPRNVRKYCEFHKQNWYTTSECRELKKPLHELADKGQIDRFLKKGSHFLHGEREPAQPQPWDKECSIHRQGLCEGHDPISLEGSAQKHAAGTHS